MPRSTVTLASAGPLGFLPRTGGAFRGRGLDDAPDGDMPGEVRGAGFDGFVCFFFAIREV